MTHDWDDAFTNGAYIPGSEDLPAIWAGQAETFRASLGARCEPDIPYGDGPRQSLDLLLPETPPLGLFVFIHGGYWLACGKSDWSHLAAGALAHGWAVAMPQYTLAPAATLPEMVRELGQAVSLAAKRIDGPIRLAGHSAGGHLAMRLVCADTPLAAPVAQRIDRAVSISGLHDLRPLRHTEMNRTLGIDAAIARTESPALLEPATTAQITAWVGAAERPEFIRQARLLALIWAGLDVAIELVETPDEHHFSVIDGLADPASPLCRCLFG